MTQHRSFKRIVRARMAKTGESYTAARSSILAAAGTDEAQAPVMPQSDSTLRDRTGQGWEHWLALLDDWGARERNLPVEELFDAVMDESSRDLWLGHAELEVRTATRPRGARFNRRGDSSRVIVGFEAKGEGKSVVAVSHERLEDSTEVERMKGVWRAALTALKTRLEV